MRESAARSRAGWTVIGGAAALFLAYALLHVVGQPDEVHEVIDLLGGSVTMVCLLGMVAFTYYRARERDPGARSGWLLCRWFAGGVFALGIAAAMTFVYQEAKGSALVEAQFSIVMWAAGGGATGLLIGHVDARRRAAQASVEAAREEADRLAQRLSVLNRVLRHDVRTDLNVILGCADEVGDRFETEPEELELLRARANRLVDVATRARAIEGLLEDTSTGPVPVGDRLAELVAELAEERPGVDVTADVDEDAVACAHRLVRVALGDLLDVALGGNVSALRVTCRVVDGVV
ncbi:MAG: hypothetical protein ABEJ80_08355, partial [Halarchaeum sp.]